MGEEVLLCAATCTGSHGSSKTLRSSSSSSAAVVLRLPLSVVYRPGSFMHTKVPPTLSIDVVHDRAYFRRGGCAAGGQKGVQHAPA